MRALLPRSLEAAAILLIVLLAGCELSGPQSQPQLTKSQFYDKCSDWPALIDRCVSDKDTVVGKKLPGLSEGINGRRLHHYTSCFCEVQTKPEGMGKLAESLKAEVNKVAQQLGVEIDEEGSGKDAKGSGGSYECEYTSGNAHGRVTITVHEERSDPKQPGIVLFGLTTKIEEWVR